MVIHALRRHPDRVERAIIDGTPSGCELWRRRRQVGLAAAHDVVIIRVASQFVVAGAPLEEVPSWADARPRIDMAGSRWSAHESRSVGSPLLKGS